VGIDEAYRAAGHAPYTVEMKVSFRAEMKQGDAFYVTTQVVDADDKRLWLFHRLHRVADGVIAATGEHLFLHVDAKSAKATPFPADLSAQLAELKAAHAGLERPDGAGRGIAMKKA
jgi:carnitine 3-dehydrogenase